MDIIHLIPTAPLVDLILLGGLVAAFVVGFGAGPIRPLLGIVGLLIAFVVAANVRDVAGALLAGAWSQFPLGYDTLLGFAIAFAALFVLASILLRRSYRSGRTVGQPMAFKLVGGVLGAAEGLLLIVIAVTILESYMIPSVAFPGEIGVLRVVQDQLIHVSLIGAAIRDSVVPSFVTALSALLPTDLVSLLV